MKETRSVGRPKLADKKLVRESVVMVSMCFVMMMMLLSVGINNPSLSSLTGSVIKKDACTINTYKISNTSLKVIMRCNESVRDANLMGTNLKKHNNELIGYKTISIDTNKHIKYGWTSKINNQSINKTYIIQNK